MPAFADLSTLVPASALVVLALVRYLPIALVTLVAGLVAALTRNAGKGQRALDVLRLLRGNTRTRRHSRGGS